MAQERHDRPAAAGTPGTPGEDGCADPPEPTHSQTRARLDSSSPEGAERSNRVSGRPSAFGPPRPSTRPSAPPPSPLSDLLAIANEPDDDRLDEDLTPPGLRALPPVELSPVIASKTRSTPPLQPALKQPSATPRAAPFAPAQPFSSTAPTGAPTGAPAGPATFRADISEILPVSVGGASLPRPPSLPDPSAPAAASTDNRRTWISVGVFTVMLAASMAPILRYAGVLGSSRAAGADVVRTAAQPRLAPRLAEAPSSATERAPQQPALPAAAAVPLQARDAFAEALAHIEGGLPEDPEKAADMLLAEGHKALAAGDIRLAETLLGRALKLDEHNPHAAFALARIRLGQGNLEGAEGWVLSAIRKRPRRAEYHALYADILARLGRAGEARHEQERAEKLAQRH